MKDGRLELRLKRPWRDGTVALRYAPHELLERLVALVPRPRRHLTRYHGVLVVGLTATPERSDGKSLLPDFDNHVAAELRLWHALERQLLVPFEYFGLSDGVDLRNLRWSRAGYELDQLGEVYGGNEARADLVRAQLARRVRDVRAVRALGFCVSVQHAEFMAARFTAGGVPAMAVHGGSDREVREDARRRLQQREVNVLFTCDLYNEGVDLRYLDTLLLLRPTMSATLFLQQLGLGLRLHRDKSSGSGATIDSRCSSCAAPNTLPLLAASCCRTWISTCSPPSLNTRIRRKRCASYASPCAAD